MTNSEKPAGMPPVAPLNRLFQRKSVDQVQTEYAHSELKRSLGPVNLILLGIGCIIGAGIFVRTGNAAALHAGPAVILSFVIAGIVCAFAGLCYAELASVLPVSGSAYTYSYVTIGEFGAWVMGSLLLLEYGLAASVVAVGWSGYAVSLLHDIGINIPPEFTQAVGKYVVAHAAILQVTDPTVGLNAVTGTLAGGDQVQFLAGSSAILPGVYEVKLAQFDVVSAAHTGYALTNSADISLDMDIRATIAAVAKVLSADGSLHDLSASTVFTVPAGSIVQLPAGSSISLAEGAVVKSIMNLPAVAVVLVMMLLLIVGVSESAKVNNVIVAIKVTVIVVFCVVGAGYVNPDNWHPFIPEPTGEPGVFGMDGVLRAATVVFFAYIGFEAVSTAAGEAKNPQHDMPFGILGSLLICTILYIFTSAVLTGVIPYTKLNVAAPVATAVNEFGPQWAWLAYSIKIGAIAGLTSVILVLMFGQTRIFYTMSRDGLLPNVLAKVHKSFRTPWINTIITGVLCASAAAFFDINTLGDLTSVGTLAAFAIVCLAVIWLRRTRPDLERGFRTPFYPVTPILGILSCVFLITRVEHRVQVFFFYFLIGAVSLYFVYGIWNSKLGRGITVAGHEPPPMDLPKG
ncbi:MAG: amino acid permease [Gammaproteobacteria bacterium]|nr:amino acid permease [Gammaproteobacteria bacterium]